MIDKCSDKCKAFADRIDVCLCDNEAEFLANTATALELNLSSGECLTLEMIDEMIDGRGDDDE
jgi:hypothetical protein